MRRLTMLLAAFAVLLLAFPSAARAENLGGAQLDLPGRQANLGPSAAPLPEIWAATWILVDATDGAVLAAKNAHERRPPASTLKTLTALTLLPRLALDRQVVGTAKAARTEGARVGVVPGQVYSVEQLLYGLMLESGNDAAIALAQANGGVKKTVREMNEVARSLNARNTLAKTPNGLDRPGQLSTAYDLALIARAGLARQDFAQIVGTKKASFPNKGKGAHPIYNQNRLLTGGYRGAVGVKTGFTTDAGRTFVGAATRKGRTLIFVGMGIKEGSSNAARKALTWGFRNRDLITPIGSLAAPVSAVAAAAVAAAPSPEASNIDLSTAGLDVPAAGDPMAPWWFWLLLLIAVAGVFVLWRAYRLRTSEMHRARHRRAAVTPSPFEPR